MTSQIKICWLQLKLLVVKGLTLMVLRICQLDRLTCQKVIKINLVAVHRFRVLQILLLIQSVWVSLVVQSLKKRHLLGIWAVTRSINTYLTSVSIHNISIDMLWIYRTGHLDFKCILGSMYKTTLDPHSGGCSILQLFHSVRVVLYIQLPSTDCTFHRHMAQSSPVAFPCAAKFTVSV